MGNYFTTVYLYASTTLKRGLRDPLTTIILVGIPVLLLVIFGLLYGSDQEVRLRTAIVNHSTEQFASEFEKSLEENDVLDVPSESIALDNALQQMRDGELDTVIELPATFGQANTEGLPSGDVTLYTDQSDAQTAQIATSIMKSITDEYNRQLIGVQMPLNITPKSIYVSGAQPIHWIFPIFAGLGLLMIGTLGISSIMPTDKKAQILRRLHVTPLRKSQVVLGTGLAFFTLGVAVVILMTLIAVFMLGMEVNGNLLTLGWFALLGLVTLVGLGLIVGGIAKNPTQGESIGQVLFLASLALSGIWVPIAMMPEFLQGIVSFMPLTPIIDGLRLILVENAGFMELLPQVAVIAAWGIITFALSFKLFRWE